LDPLSSQLAARAARAFTPDGIARILRELGKWTVNAIKSSLQGIFKSLWNAFWTGSLVATLAISVLIVVGAEFAISGLGLSAADRSSTMTTVGGVLLLAWLIRLLLYMVSGGRSRA
jgi:hypothetical protein